MVKVKTFIIALFISIHIQASESWTSLMINDMHDTVSTGMPVALSAAVLWAVANRIPHDWQDLQGSAADFIYDTWAQQGFKRCRKIILKRIPAHSVLSRLVVYTQELPGALAVGDQFVDRITKLLEEKALFEKQKSTVVDPVKKQELEQALQEVEVGLDECRFVCGHERVHKERQHTYQLLMTQFLAPFFVYSFLKFVKKVLIKRDPDSFVCPWLLQTSLARSSLELFIGWLRTRQFEYEADVYASTDPKILRAGLGLFKRALSKKVIKLPVYPKEWAETIIGWILKYTHPTLPERVYYLERHIKKLEKKRKVF